MNEKFDEMAKGLAQSVTRRGALKKFGVGLAGIALAALGLAHDAEATPKPCLSSGALHCKNNHECCSGLCIKGGGFIPSQCA